MDTIVISSQKELNELKELYKKAGPGEVFTFKGHEILKGYAKYLIEYVEQQYKKG